MNMIATEIFDARKSKLQHAVMTLMLVGLVLSLAESAFPQSEKEDILFDKLPVVEQNKITQARQECKAGEAWPADDYKGFSRANLDKGLMGVRLNGDKLVSVLISYERICNFIVPAANCSNRGCDLVIYRQTEPAKWIKVFNEHVRPEVLVSLDYNDGLRLLGVSIVGGNKQCVAKEIAPASHMYCDALVYWRCRPECGWNLRCAISSDMKLSD
jgi:hypothetical protein